MVIIKETEFKDDALKNIAEKMCIAARTAPKTRGQDQLVTLIITGDMIKKISKKMKDIGEKKDIHFFLRDSESILQAPVVVLLGTKFGSLNVPNCGYCGFKDCAEREKTTAACALASGDLGIAVGSALSVAMDNRVDNRLMLSIGKAALELGIFDKDVQVAFGVSLSATGKNPFFDRK